MRGQQRTGQATKLLYKSAYFCVGRPKLILVLRSVQQILLLTIDKVEVGVSLKSAKVKQGFKIWEEGVNKKEKKIN